MDVDISNLWRPAHRLLLQQMHRRLRSPRVNHYQSVRPTKSDIPLGRTIRRVVDVSLAGRPAVHPHAASRLGSGLSYTEDHRRRCAADTVRRVVGRRGISDWVLRLGTNRASSQWRRPLSESIQPNEHGKNTYRSRDRTPTAHTGPSCNQGKAWPTPGR